MKEQKVISALRAAWEREIEAAQLYRVLGEQQEEERRQKIFIRLAEAEEEHARQFAARIQALGGTAPAMDTKPTAAQRVMARTLGADAMLRRLEAEEERNIAQFERHAQALQEDADLHALFIRIEDEEKQHATMIHALKSPDEPKTRLEAMLKGEKWHVSTGSWIGDAIYGVNDGLGAVFGVISGMAGYAGTRTDAFHFVVASGLVATLASALSMGSSAFMASKAEREVHQAEIERERAEIEQSPEHEKEELELLYQLKGFSAEEATMMADRIAAQPDLEDHGAGGVGPQRTALPQSFDRRIFCGSLHRHRRHSARVALPLSDRYKGRHRRCSGRYGRPLCRRCRQEPDHCAFLVGQWL